MLALDMKLFSHQLLISFIDFSEGSLMPKMSKEKVLSYNGYKDISRNGHKDIMNLSTKYDMLNVLKWLTNIRRSILFLRILKRF